MKFLSTTTLGLALALGAASAALVVPGAAIAAPKAAKGPSYKLSDPVRKALAAAQEAVKAGDFAGAQAQVTQAKAAIKTEDDRFLTYNQLYEIGKGLKDTKVQAEAIEGMLQSGRVPAESQANFYLALGQLAFNNQNYPQAEQALGQAVALKVADPAAFALLAETKYKAKKPAEAVALIQQAVDEGEAKGTPVPKDWMARGIAIGADAKLADPVTKLTRSWLKAYPTQGNWRDALLIYRDLRPVDAEYNLDLMRLQRQAGALRGERDFVELAEATYVKFPNEAKTLIEQGTAAGALNLAQSKSAKELSTIAAGKIASDKASLNKKATNGRIALSTADAYASYGDYASAIELYGKALTAGGVDANVVNTRLGAALFRSGQKEEAKKVFSTITGPRADLAAYWMIFIDHPPTAG